MSGTRHIAPRPADTGERPPLLNMQVRGTSRSNDQAAPSMHMNIPGARYSDDDNASTSRVAPASNGIGVIDHGHTNPLGMSPRQPQWDNRARPPGSNNLAISTTNSHMGDISARNLTGNGMGPSSQTLGLKRTSPRRPGMQLDLRNTSNGTAIREEVRIKGAYVEEQDLAGSRQQQSRQQQMLSNHQQSLDQERRQLTREPPLHRTFDPQDGQSGHTSPDVGTSLSAPAAAPREYQSNALPPNKYSNDDQYANLKDYYRQPTAPVLSRKDGDSRRPEDRASVVPADTPVNAHQYADPQMIYLQSTVQHAAPSRGSGNIPPPAAHADVKAARPSDDYTPISMNENTPESCDSRPAASSIAEPAILEGSPSNPVLKPAHRFTSPTAPGKETIEAALLAAKGWQASEDREMERSEHGSTRALAPPGDAFADAVSSAMEIRMTRPKNTGLAQEQTGTPPRDREAIGTEPSVEMANLVECIDIAETAAGAGTLTEADDQNMTAAETSRANQGLQLAGIAGAWQSAYLLCVD